MPKPLVPYSQRHHSPESNGSDEVSLLVVNGSAEARGTIVRYLNDEEHCRVSSADNGLQALAKIAREKFDLVLLDLDLPGMDGYQVLKNLKADEALRLTPVVVMTTGDKLDGLARCLEAGADDFLIWPFNEPLLHSRVDAALEKKRLQNLEIYYVTHVHKEKERAEKLLNVVIPVGVALSSEKDFDKLLEMILLEGKALCNADAGSLYLRTDEDELKFVMVHNDTLKMAQGGTTGNPIQFKPLRMYNEARQPNHNNVATHSALSGESVNIANAYTTEGFDFSGTKLFDRNTGYLSTSFLTIPLKNNYSRVIGVLQLINAKDPETEAVIPFEPELQQMIESLSALATVALEVYIREQGLRKQIEQLKIEIDTGRSAKQVAEITETDYFKGLQERARKLRSGDPSPREPGSPASP